MVGWMWIRKLMFLWIVVSVWSSMDFHKRTGFEKHNLFDPSGRQMQFEYSEVAISRNSGPMCCIQVSDGILFMSARRTRRSRLSRRLPPKTTLLDNGRILASVSGLMYDGISVLERVSGIVEKYHDLFPVGEDHPLTIESIVADYCGSLYRRNDLHAEKYYPRDEEEAVLPRIPGVHLLMAGCGSGDGNMPTTIRLPKGRIYLVRPDGGRSQHRIIARGKDFEALQQELVDILGDDNASFSSSGRSSFSIDQLLAEFRKRNMVLRYFLSENGRPAADRNPLNAFELAELCDLEVRLHYALVSTR